MITCAPRSVLLAAALSLVFVGCRTNPATGVDDVQKTVSTRTGQAVEWPRTVAENDKTEQAIAQLLTQALTADTAVQIA